MTRTTGVGLRRRFMVVLALFALAAQVAAAGTARADDDDHKKDGPRHARLVTSDLPPGTLGSTIGPDGMLYVAEGGATGGVAQVNPRTGEINQVASGLPTFLRGAPYGGVFDVAFIGNTLYALVSLLPAHPEQVGIYRIDGPGPADHTLVAALGLWSQEHPPPFRVDVDSGVQFAMEPVFGGFVVSDGHHNRVLQVLTLPVGPTEEDRDRDIRTLIQCGNVVPTGLEVSGSTVYVSEVGPVPYAPADGKVVSFEAIGLPKTPSCDVNEIASGFSTMVDVEFGPDRALYALSQGDCPGIVDAATPALPDSGELLKVNDDGTFSVVVDRLNRPNSVEFIGDTAYIVTLNGEVWKVKHVDELAEHPRPDRSSTALCP